MIGRPEKGNHLFAQRLGHGLAQRIRCHDQSAAVDPLKILIQAFLPLLPGYRIFLFQQTFQLLPVLGRPRLGRPFAAHRIIKADIVFYLISFRLLKDIPLAFPCPADRLEQDLQAAFIDPFLILLPGQQKACLILIAGNIVVPFIKIKTEPALRLDGSKIRADADILFKIYKDIIGAAQDFL